MEHKKCCFLLYLHYILHVPIWHTIDSCGHRAVDIEWRLSLLWIYLCFLTTAPRVIPELYHIATLNNYKQVNMFSSKLSADVIIFVFILICLSAKRHALTRLTFHLQCTRAKPTCWRGWPSSWCRTLMSCVASLSYPPRHPSLVPRKSPLTLAPRAASLTIWPNRPSASDPAHGGEEWPGRSCGTLRRRRCGCRKKFRGQRSESTSRVRKVKLSL